MSLFAELKRRNVIRVAIVYVATAWLLIQVVETLFPVYGLSDNAIRVVVAVLGVGFVPALIVAWVFELTPEGLKFDAEVAPGAPSRLRAHKLLDRVIMITLALAVGYFAFDKFVLDPAEDVEIAEEAEQRGRSEALIESYGDKSIAVLPFVNMSADPDQVYFSDGIAEELLNLLAKIPELRVISRSSAFSFRGDDINIREVSDKLDVSHVLEGSVRRSGNKIRVTAQLIEARTDTHLWSETYDRELGDIFAIQDDIATIVVGELESRLLDELPASRKTDPEAYALFLQARHYAFQGGGANEHQRAETLLKRVLELDPEYAPAWTVLGLVQYLEAGDWDGAKYTIEEGNQLFNAAAERALALNPEDGVASSYLGWRRFYDDGDMEAVRLFEKAVAYEPNNFEVMRSTGAFARTIGHWDKAVALGQRAIDLDPLCVLCYWNLTVANLYAGRLDEAEAVARKRADLFDRGWHMLGTVLLMQGRFEAALEACDTLEKFGEEGLDTQRLHCRTRVLYSLGRLDEYRESLAAAQEMSGDGWPSGIAQLHAWAGDADAAFDMLDKALKPGHMEFNFNFLAGTAWNPAYRNLHDDPRWQAYWDETGTTPEELQAIEFNINLPPR